MNTLIVGHGESGKDELGKLLGLSYMSSSEAAMHIFIWEDWGKSRYDSMEDCYADRRNHRQEWYEMICGYNLTDKARLAKKITEANGTYVGMRCDKELAACKEQGVFDLIIWVDARGRVPNEPSCHVTEAMCDITIDNTGTLEQFYVNITELAGYIAGFEDALDEVNTNEVSKEYTNGYAAGSIKKYNDE